MKEVRLGENAKFWVSVEEREYHDSIVEVTFISPSVWDVREQYFECDD